MIDLFIALFGSAFYGGVALNKNRQKASNKMRDVIASADAQHNVGHMNFQRQREISSYVRSGLYVDEIYEKLDDDLKFVFGEDFKREDFYLPGTDGYEYFGYPAIFKENSYWATVLLLAHEGILHDTITSPGLPIGYDDYIIRDIKFCQRVEEALNQNGMSITLCFYADAGKSKTNLSGGCLKPEPTCSSEIIRLWKNFVDEKPRLGKIKVYYFKKSLY